MILFLAFTAGTTFLPRTASAQSLNWGPSGTGTPAGGSGNWDTTSNFWKQDASTTYQPWPNADDNAVAVFGGTPGTVTLTTGIFASAVTFTVDGYVLNNTAGGSLTMVNNGSGSGPVITVANAGQTATIDAPLVVNVTNLVLTGLGTLALAGAENSTTNSQINIEGGGALQLDAATGSLSSNNSIVLGSTTSGSTGTGGSGTFIYDNTGATGASTQSLGQLQVVSGDDTVETNRVAAQKVTLGFTGEVVGAGATVNFVVNGGTVGTQNVISLAGQNAGFMGKAVFFNGSSYAWYAAGGYVRAINYGVDRGTVTTSGAASITGTNVQTTGAVTAQTTTTFTSLNLAGTSTTAGGNDFTLTNGQTLTVNGILRSGNVAGSSATIGGGAGIQAANNQELVIRTDQVNDSLTISSPILANGTNTFVKSGAGTLTLTGANTYTGITYIDGGVLSIATIGNLSAASTLGAPTTATKGKIQLDGGALQYTGATASTDRGFNVGIGGGGINVSQAGTTLTFTGTSTGADTSLVSDSLVKTGTGTLVLGGTGDNAGLSVVIDAGKVVLAKTQPGSHAVDSSLGLVVNSGGTAQLGGTNSDQIYDGANVIVNTGGTFDLNGRNEAWDGLSGGGLITDTTNTPGILTLGANNNSSSNSLDVFSGTIADGAGQVALTKEGTGTQTLSGTNTYTGATLVAGGILDVQGSTTNSTTTISNSGTLAGIGSVGNITVNSGGTLSPGDATTSLGPNLSSSNTFNNVLTAESLTAAGGAILQYNLSSSATASSSSNPAGSTLIDLGQGAFNGSSVSTSNQIILNFQNSSSGTLDPSIYSLVEFGLGSGSGNTNLTTSDFQIENLNYLAGQYGLLSFTQSGGQEVLQLEVVPEPGTWTLLLGSLGLLAFWRRRRCNGN